MKKCSVCQSLQDDRNRFCSRCGSEQFLPVAEQVKNGGWDAKTLQTSPKKSKSDGILFALLGVAAGLVIVIVVVAMVLLNPVSQIMRSIEKNDFEEAADIYEERIMDDTDRYDKTYDEISAYVDELLEDYINQKVTYDFLINKLDGIAQIGILGSELYSAYEEANELHYYRETYASAEKAFEEKSYAKAISLYAAIADADFENGKDAKEKYGQAVELYREEISEEVQGYLDSGDYDLAMTLLDQALEVIPGDAELLALQQDCIEAQYNENIQQMIDEANVYKNQGDYPGALACLDAYIEAYPDELALQKERSKCLEEYEAYVIEESLELANAGKYQNALSLAESGLNYFSSTEVTELAEIYRSYIPVLLGEMEMFQNNTDGGSWRSKTDKTDKYLEDNYGNTYSNSMSVGCGTVVYLVNFQYKTFSGTVAFPKGLETDSYRTSATLKIYGDGVKIAEFTDVGEDTRPAAFSLDISSYEKITLEWTCKGANIWEDWGDFATIFDGVFAPEPKELPESV